MGTGIQDDRKSSQVINCPERIDVVQFCPFGDQGGSLLASAGNNFVHLDVLHFPQFETEIEEFYSEELVNVRHSSAVTSLSWSPATSIQTHPLNVTFCTGGGDNAIRVISINYKKDASVKVIGQHKSFINDVAMDVFTGTQVASVGDDKKLCIWDAESCKEQVSFGLQSAGVSVKWNPLERGKLMVAEEGGRVRFYDMVSNKPIMSFDVISGPLLSADWSESDSFKIGALAGSSWYVWDMSKSSLPHTSGKAFSSPGHYFRWSSFDSDMFALRGESEVRIFNLHHSTAPAVRQVQSGGGVSWHKSLPVLAAGGDRKTNLWSFETL